MPKQTNKGNLRSTDDEQSILQVPAYGHFSSLRPLHASTTLPNLSRRIDVACSCGQLDATISATDAEPNVDSLPRAFDLGANISSARSGEEPL